MRGRVPRTTRCISLAVRWAIRWSTRMSRPKHELRTYRISAPFEAVLSWRVLSQSAFQGPPQRRLRHHPNRHGFLHHQPPQQRSPAKARIQSERKETRKTRFWLQGWVEHCRATMTYALEQIVQLTNSLLLLPLHAADPNAWSVDGPFSPDGGTILHSPLVRWGSFEHDMRSVSSQSGNAFWVCHRLLEVV